LKHASPANGLEPHTGPKHSVKHAYGGSMVNAGVVNRETCVSNTPLSVKFSAFFGRFLYFKNTIKYICNSRINHKTVHLLAIQAARPSKLY
jgi:hypothetical protein